MLAKIICLIKQNETVLLYKIRMQTCCQFCPTQNSNNISFLTECLKIREIAYTKEWGTVFPLYKRTVFKLCIDIFTSNFGKIFCFVNIKSVITLYYSQIFVCPYVEVRFDRCCRPCFLWTFYEPSLKYF